MIYHLIEYLRKLNISDLTILFDAYLISILVTEYIIGCIKNKLASDPSQGEKSAASLTIYILGLYIVFGIWFYVN